MEITELLKILSGPLIGAVIGYFTNMIAVKMLFYPRHEVRLFGHRLPLTPGVIPKGRPRLATAVGAVVSQHLLAPEDIKRHLLTEQAENKLADVVMEKLSDNLGEEIRTLTALDSAAYAQKKAALSKAVSDQIVKAIQTSDATETVLSAVGETIKERTNTPMLKLFVNDRTISSLMQPTKEAIDTMIDEHGSEYIAPILSKKLDEADSGSGLALLEQFGIGEQAVREAVIGAYRNIVEQSVESVLQHINIAALVEDKINAMPIDELERLVQDVMNKELNAIVNLGALIGFVLGLLNLII